MHFTAVVNKVFEAILCFSFASILLNGQNDTLLLSPYEAQQAYEISYQMKKKKYKKFICFSPQRSIHLA